jgi:glycosyltransferase involved in cell wall biosynthesis
MEGQTEQIGTDPLVSVVIPCFNAGSTLARTLNSVTQQSYPRLEIIIVDDGSTDSSRQVATLFADQDDRIRILEQDNRGVAAARNRAIAEASGNLIAPIDADDLWAPAKIERQVRMIEADPALGLVYCWFENINFDDEIIAGGFHFSFEGDVLPDMARFDFVGNGSNALMRREAIEEAGGYDVSLRAAGAEGCEDWKLWLTIAESWRFGVVAQPLVGYRHSAGNMSSRTAQMLRSADRISAEFRERHPELSETFKAHMADRIFWNFCRSVDDGNWADAKELLVRYPLLGWKSALSHLARSPLQIGRTKASRLAHRIQNVGGNGASRRSFIAR